MRRSGPGLIVVGIVAASVATPSSAQVLTPDGRYLTRPANYSFFHASEFLCKSMAENWQKYNRAVRDAHQACLDANKGQNSGGTTCSVSSCQGLHTEMNESGNEDVSECWATVRRKQAEERAAKAKSESVRRYDRATDILDTAKEQADKAMPKTPVNRLAQEVRDQSLDSLHDRNRQTLEALDRLDRDVRDMSERGSHTPPQAPPPASARTPVPSSTNGAAHHDLENRAMNETDPYRLRRLIAEYERLADRERCGRPCNEVVDQLRRRLRDID